VLSIAIVSLKGGVGKTTVTLGLAGAAQQLGLRVLVVDLDPQANSTLGLDPVGMKFSINDVLADGREGIAAAAVVPSGWGPEVSVLGSEVALEHRNTTGDAKSALRLRKALRGVGEDYDLVLIDCPPSIGEVTRNGLAAATHALVVTEPNFFALRGAEQALDAIAIVRDNINLRLRALGVVVNRMRPSLTEHAFRLEELREAYPQLLLQPSIPERSVVPRAEGAGVPFHAEGRAGVAVSATFTELLTQLRDRAQPQRVSGDAK